MGPGLIHFGFHFYLRFDSSVLKDKDATCKHFSFDRRPFIDALIKALNGTKMFASTCSIVKEPKGKQKSGQTSGVSRACAP